MRYRGNDKGKKMKNDNKVVNITPQKKQQKKSDDLEDTNCFFCGAEGHDVVCYEINLTSVPRHT